MWWRNTERDKSGRRRLIGWPEDGLRRLLAFFVARRRQRGLGFRREPDDKSNVMFSSVLQKYSQSRSTFPPEALPQQKYIFSRYAFPTEAHPQPRHIPSGGIFPTEAHSQTRRTPSTSTFPAEAHSQKHIPSIGTFAAQAHGHNFYSQQKDIPSRGIFPANAHSQQIRTPSRSAFPAQALPSLDIFPAESYSQHRQHLQQKNIDSMGTGAYSQLRHNNHLSTIRFTQLYTEVFQL